MLYEVITAVGLVDLDLALHDAGEDFRSAAHDRRGHLVAGALDAENEVEDQPARRSSFSCSDLQSMHNSATGRASRRFIV